MAGGAENKAGGCPRLLIVLQVLHRIFLLPKHDGRINLLSAQGRPHPVTAAGEMSRAGWCWGELVTVFCTALSPGGEWSLEASTWDSLHIRQWLLRYPQLLSSKLAMRAPFQDRWSSLSSSATTFHGLQPGSVRSAWLKHYTLVTNQHSHRTLFFHANARTGTLNARRWIFWIYNVADSSASKSMMYYT